MLEHFDSTIRIPPEKMPSVQLTLMLSILTNVQTIRLELCEAICSLDKSKKLDELLELSENRANKIADELRATLLAKFGE